MPLNENPHENFLRTPLVLTYIDMQWTRNIARGWGSRPQAALSGRRQIVDYKLFYKVV